MRSIEIEKIETPVNMPRKLGDASCGHPPAVPAHDDPGGVVFRFGSFEVSPGTRTLLKDGLPIAIGSRAFDLLVVLVRSSGVIVSKETILNQVWPSTIVAEGNLRYQMTALRKVLSHERDTIKNIPGRGYLFTAEVSVLSASQTIMSPPAGRERSFTQVVPQEREPNDVLTARAAVSSEPSVVVIDDDADTREALRSLLRSVGLRVEMFPSIQAFLDAPELTTPGCLLLDVWLPGKTGLEFQAALAKTAKSPPVILMSGQADVPMSVKAMKAGALDFLTKPVRHEELLDAVQRALAL